MEIDERDQRVVLVDDARLALSRDESTEDAVADEPAIRAPVEQVVGAQVLERLEPGAEGAEVHVAVVRDDGLLQGEVARGPCARPRRDSARRNQSAVHSPRPRSATIRAFTSSSGSTRELVEVEVGAGERDDVLGLPPREPEGYQLLLPRRRDPLPRRKATRARRVAEALDHPAADGERREHRDLLGRDRAHEGLERVRRERRPEAGQLPRQPREHGSACANVVEVVKVERRAEQSE